MLTKLIINKFKGLTDCEIDLGHNVVFVGPNNSGKTTALQALSLWETGLHFWMSKRLSESKTIKKSGVAISRRDLIAVPVSNTRYLWQNQNVRVSGGTNKVSRQKTENVHITVTVEGNFDRTSWACGLEFDYANPETFYCRPTKDQNNLLWNLSESRRELLDRLRVVFLPPMSGLAPVERKLERGSIDVLIGEGQTAQVLRNLCNNLYQDNREQWNLLRSQLCGLFGIVLHEPLYDSARGEITLFYNDFQAPHKNEQLEISSAGRGLQQVLLILTFLYLHPGSIILLDEPDAHLEILRQKQIYDTIKSVAKKQNGQIIAATHSEVILNESAERDTVIAFLGKPHKLNDKSQLIKSLTNIGWEQYLLSEQKGWILYLEGTTDLEMLKKFAKLLNHPAKDVLENVFFHSIGDNSPKNAEKHFYAIREAKPDLHAFALFDRIVDTKIKSINGLTEYSLKRCELENYFCNKNVLVRWARGYLSGDVIGTLLQLTEQEEQTEREKIMLECIEEYSKLFIEYQKETDSLWSPNLKASDKVLAPILSKFFEKTGRNPQVQKSRFCELIPFMLADEVDEEIAHILDTINQTASNVKESNHK
ncbi:MAG: AAA family ATPase [Planctomycetaceae bacterium]|jgi:ABC-type lipoprotein export system ATPase subunit|nr:AAA family ATPase [Planctomycetaceae bacterium]